MKGYKGVNLPEEFINLIQNMIKSHPEWGYKAVAEFVKDGARRQLLDLQKMK